MHRSSRQQCRFVRPLGHGVVAGACLLLSACTAPEPIVLLEADETRDSAYGTDGPLGALLQQRTIRVRVDETVKTDITVPTDADGAALSGPLPTIVLLPGGAVQSDRYRWLAAHFASRGFVVVSPYFATFSLFEVGNVVAVLDHVKDSAERPEDTLYGAIDPEVPVMITGHSLGGVTSSKVWLDLPDEVTHLAFLASTTDANDDFSTRPDPTGEAAVLTVSGALDGRIDPDTVSEGVEGFSIPVTGALVEGMNHLQWVDDVTEKESEDDYVATIPEDEARYLGLYLVDALADDFANGTQGVLDAPESWPEGLTSLELP